MVMCKRYNVLLLSIQRVQILVVQLSRCSWQLVAGMTHLEYLDAAFTNLSNSLLPALASLSKLTHLDVDSTAVSDQGLTVIGRFTALQNLCLADTR